jgi:5-methyltetrahydropteroyltriglutamate--homocysteine methyltransferase
MKQSHDRILTTHTGSLPRPLPLRDTILARERGEPVETDALEALLRSGAREIVRQQIEAGIDIVSDGELSKPGYSTYVKDRLTGFHGVGGAPMVSDLAEYPSYMEREFERDGLRTLQMPACDGRVEYVGQSALQRDVANFRSALEGTHCEEAFMTAASPGVISLFLQNQFYESHEAYLSALSDAMRNEYEAIHQAGFILQIDCPDLAMGRHIQFADKSLDEFCRQAELHVEALNRAVARIPADRMRIHVCWANYEGPHHRDVALRDIVDIVLRARPAGLSFVAANPRHEHEWKVWRDVALPDGKVLIPGVIDSTTNFIEHPELIAERIERFADIVGPEHVIAGTDCGFATFAAMATVDPNIAWAKLAALSEGAKLATARLYRRSHRVLVGMASQTRRAAASLRGLRRN